MFDRALTIGSPAAAAINWESAHEFFARRMRTEVDRIVRSWAVRPKKRAVKKISRSV